MTGQVGPSFYVTGCMAITTSGHFIHEIVASFGFRPTVRVGEKAPNITFTGKAGKWSEERMVKFLKSGRSDPPMPAYKLTDEDARAVTAYLRSLTGGEKTKRKGNG